MILKNVRPMEFCYDLKCPQALVFQLWFSLSLLLVDSHSCLDRCLITYKGLHSGNKKGSESESSDTLTVGMFISYLPHVTAQSTCMRRTAVLTRKDGDLSSCYAALTDCFLEISFCI